MIDDPRFEPDGKNSTGLGADVAPLRAEYEAVLRHHTAAELVSLVQRLEGAAYPYHTSETLFTDAQAQVLQLLQRIPGPEGELTAIKNPWNFSTIQPVVQCGPPTLGNATEAVLTELGYTAVRIAGLPWSFSLTPGVLRSGPLPGSDTAEVLAEVLGETMA